MLFDTHAHLFDPQFQEDRDQVIQNIDDHMSLVVNVTCNLPASRRNIQLIEQHDKIYGAIGLHPNDAKDFTEELWSEYIQLAQHRKIVAIGETGLDYYWKRATVEEQTQLFLKHIQLAKQLHKPIIVHDRDAHQDTMNILKQYAAPQGVIGILHAYSGSVEMAQELLALGFYISLAGPVTFKNANKLLDVAKEVPLDRLLIETDCPYMAPAPMRGKRNEPMLVKHIAEKIAELRGISYEQIVQATYENGKTIFGIV